MEQSDDYALITCYYLLSDPELFNDWQRTPEENRARWLENEGFSSEQLRRSCTAIQSQKELTPISTLITKILNKKPANTSLEELKKAFSKYSENLISLSGGNHNILARLNSTWASKDKKWIEEIRDKKTVEPDTLSHEYQPLIKTTETEVKQETQYKVKGEQHNQLDVSSNKTKTQLEAGNTNTKQPKHERCTHYEEQSKKHFQEAEVITSFRRSIRELKMMSHTIQYAETQQKEDNELSSIQLGIQTKTINAKRAFENSENTKAKKDIKALYSQWRLYNTATHLWLQARQWLLEPSNDSRKASHIVGYRGRGEGSISPVHKKLDIWLVKRKLHSKKPINNKKLQNTDWTYIIAHLPRELFWKENQHTQTTKDRAALHMLFIDSRFEKLINPELWSKKRRNLLAKKYGNLKEYNWAKSVLKKQLWGARASLEIKRDSLEIIRSNTIGASLTQAWRANTPSYRRIKQALIKEYRSYSKLKKLVKTRWGGAIEKHEFWHDFDYFYLDHKLYKLPVFNNLKWWRQIWVEENAIAWFNSQSQTTQNKITIRCVNNFKKQVNQELIRLPEKDKFQCYLLEAILKSRVERSRIQEYQHAEDKDAAFIFSKEVNSKGGLTEHTGGEVELDMGFNLIPDNPFASEVYNQKYWTFNIGRNDKDEQSGISYECNQVNNGNIWYFTPRTNIWRPNAISIQTLRRGINKSILTTWRRYKKLKQISLESNKAIQQDIISINKPQINSKIEALSEWSKKQQALHQWIHMNRNLVTSELELWSKSAFYLKHYGWQDNQYWNDLNFSRKNLRTPQEVIFYYTWTNLHNSRHGQEMANASHTTVWCFRHSKDKQKLMTADIVYDSASFITAVERNAINLGLQEYRTLRKTGFTIKQAELMADITYINDLAYIDTSLLIEGFLAYKIYPKLSGWSLYGHTYSGKPIINSLGITNAGIVALTFPLMITLQIRESKRILLDEKLAGDHRWKIRDKAAIFELRLNIIQALEDICLSYCSNESVRIEKFGYNFHENIMKPFWRETFGRSKIGRDIGITLHLFIHGLIRMPIHEVKDIDILGHQLAKGINNVSNWFTGAWFDTLKRDTKGPRKTIKYIGNWFGYIFTGGRDQKALMTTKKIFAFASFVPLMEDHWFLGLALRCQLFELSARRKLHKVSDGLIKSPVQYFLNSHLNIQKQVNHTARKAKHAAHHQIQAVGLSYFRHSLEINHNKQSHWSPYSYFALNYAAIDRRHIRRWRKSIETWWKTQLDGLRGENVTRWAVHTITQTYKRATKGIELGKWAQDNQVFKKERHLKRMIEDIDLFGEIILEVGDYAKKMQQAINKDGGFGQSGNQKDTGKNIMRKDLYYPITYTLPKISQIKAFNSKAEGPHALGARLFTDLMLSYSLSNETLLLISNIYAKRKNMLNALQAVHQKITTILSAPHGQKQKLMLRRLEQDKRIERFVKKQKQGYLQVKKNITQLKYITLQARAKTDRTAEEQLLAIKRRYRAISLMQGIGSKAITAQTINNIMVNNTPLENICVYATKTKAWPNLNHKEQRKAQEWYSWNSMNQHDRFHWEDKYKANESKGNYETAQLNKDYRLIESGETMTIGQIIASLKPTQWQAIPKLNILPLAVNSNSNNPSSPQQNQNNTPNNSSNKNPSTQPSQRQVGLFSTWARAQLFKHLYHRLAGKTKQDVEEDIATLEKEPEEISLEIDEISTEEA